MAYKKKVESLKTNFKPFRVGTIFNKLLIQVPKAVPQYSKVVIKYPSRLYAMSFDPSKIASNNNLKYTPGSVNFSICIFKTITVSLTARDTVLISPRSKRHTLIKHTIALMKSALQFDDGLTVDVDEEVPLRHCGLGSSSSLISGVACAINELYGNTIPKKHLLKYLAQNHGEEIDESDEYLSAVQCVGGSASCGMYKGGLLIIAGENTVVYSMNIPDEYDVVIGVPQNFTYPDAHTLMKKEITNMHKYKKTGQKYGREIAYKFFHNCLPDMAEGSIKAMGDLIYEYRFEMGSIENDSFAYPKILRLAKAVSILKKEGFADVLATSSNGPGMFAITKQTEVCRKVFENSGMVTFTTKIYNDTYKVLQKIPRDLYHSLPLQLN